MIWENTNLFLGKCNFPLDYHNYVVVRCPQLGIANTIYCCGGGEWPMEKIKFDYSKLKGKITEKCDTQKAFAELLGITEGTLTSKLLGYTYFTQDEVFRSLKILDIDPGKVTLYFFTV
jgi:hypothetical protein